MMLVIHDYVGITGEPLSLLPQNFTTDVLRKGSGFYHGLILLAARGMSLVPFVQDPLMLPRIHSCTPSCINPYLVPTSILKEEVV